MYGQFAFITYAFIFKALVFLELQVLANKVLSSNTILIRFIFSIPIEIPHHNLLKEEPIEIW